METSIDILKDVKGKMAQKEELGGARIEIPERTILDSVFSPPISRDVQSEIDRLDESVDNQASSPDDWGVQVEPEYLGGSSGMDYDHIYVGGIEYTPGENTEGYDFLQIGADGSSSWIEAMISPMPEGYEIYNVTKNHIHISGATAGNI